MTKTTKTKTCSCENGCCTESQAVSMENTDVVISVDSRIISWVTKHGLDKDTFFNDAMAAEICAVEAADTCSGDEDKVSISIDSKAHTQLTRAGISVNNFLEACAKEVIEKPVLAPMGPQRVSEDKKVELSITLEPMLSAQIEEYGYDISEFAQFCGWDYIMLSEVAPEAHLIDKTHESFDINMYRELHSRGVRPCYFFNKCARDMAEFMSKMPLESAKWDVQKRLHEQQLLAVQDKE